MSLRDFITALPKVDLNIQLTGALRKESLLLIASQNGIPAAHDDYAQWVALLDEPDYARLDEIARVAGGWIMYPEDLALVAYDIGVALSRQNVAYAEVSVAPADFVGGGRMHFEAFLEALNDGRDRAKRAWNVEMSWILSIPRDNPRAGDDAARWATGTAARAGNVVAMGLTGDDGLQPAGQFKRAFATAQRKEINTAASAGNSLGPSGIREAIDELRPGRLVNPWGLLDDEALASELAEAGTPLVLSIARALRLGLVERAEGFPLKALLERGLQVALGSDMPSLYGTSLTDEYVMAHESCQLTLDETTQLARRSIELSLLDDERKEPLLRDFDFGARAARAGLQDSG